MKLAFRQIEPFLKNPDPQALCILVYGPDEGQVRERARMLARHVVADLKDPFNVVDLSPERLRATPSLLQDEAKALSMLGGRRVVRVAATAADGDALRSLEQSVADTLKVLAPGDNLIIIEGGNLGAQSKLRKLCEDAKNAVTLPCYVEEERDLTRVLSGLFKEQGYMIESDALTHMAAFVQGDRAMARREAEKRAPFRRRARVSHGRKRNNQSHRQCGRSHLEQR